MCNAARIVHSDPSCSCMSYATWQQLAAAAAAAAAAGGSTTILFEACCHTIWHAAVCQMPHGRTSCGCSCWHSPSRPPSLTQRLDVALVAVVTNVAHRHHVLTPCRRGGERRGDTAAGDQCTAGELKWGAGRVVCASHASVAGEKGNATTAKAAARPMSCPQGPRGRRCRSAQGSSLTQPCGVHGSCPARLAQTRPVALLKCAAAGQPGCASKSVLAEMEMARCTCCCCGCSGSSSETCPAAAAALLR